MEKIKIELTTSKKQKPKIKGIPFGKHFTDHMFLMNYEEGMGWHDARIVPFGNLSLSPASMVFHYAQEVFEGMKAYRNPEGNILLFRPEKNIKRMNDSAERLCIPLIPEDVFIEALKELIILDKEWVPSEPDTSLYIRPFVFATDTHLGVHASTSYLFVIIMSPVGNYYPQGLNPVRILIENRDVRAVRGGTGYTKCGGNYAASLRASELAEKQGYCQVLWLDGITRRNIEEVGAMNVMFKISGKIVTPELNGSVLPGITRMSCIELLKAWGYVVEERVLSVDELIESITDGTLEEAWGTGTAAVVSPIGEISFEGEKHEIGSFKIGKLTQKLYDTLTDIQWGRLEDKYAWSVMVC